MTCSLIHGNPPKKGGAARPLLLLLLSRGVRKAANAIFGAAALPCVVSTVHHECMPVSIEAALGCP
jgi:hypothetical protein